MVELHEFQSCIVCKHRKAMVHFKKSHSALCGHIDQCFDCQKAKAIKKENTRKAQYTRYRYERKEIDGGWMSGGDEWMH